jgi:hypothetical protein
MLLDVSLSLILLAAFANANAIPSRDSSTTTPKCVEFIADTDVVAPIYPPLPPPLKDGIEATGFLNSQTRRTPDTKLFGSPVNFNGTYPISVMYCTPGVKTSKSSIVQVLTHGIGFDKK